MKYYGSYSGQSKTLKQIALENMPLPPRTRKTGEPLPYILLAANYAVDSGGTKCMHKLCHILNNKGYDCHIISHVANPAWNEKLLNDDLSIRQLIANDAVVVYPEYWAEDGNFLHAKNPVGYQMGKFGFCEPKDYKMIFTYLPYFRKDVTNTLFINGIERALFNNKGTGERPYTAVWVGKGDPRDIGMCDFTHYIAYWRDNINLDGITTVKDRYEIAQVLRKSKLLITFDSASAVITEARLCGCPATWIPNTGNTTGFNLCSKEIWLDSNASHGTLRGIAIENTPEDIRKATEEVALFEEEFDDFVKREESDIDNFIKLTQALGDR